MYDKKIEKVTKKQIIDKLKFSNVKFKPSDDKAKLFQRLKETSFIWKKAKFKVNEDIKYDLLDAKDD